MDKSSNHSGLFGYLTKDRWSPYIVGALIGVLAWIVFGAMGQTIGVTSSFVHAVAYIEYWITPSHMEQLNYFKEELRNTPLLDWQVAFVIGIFFGSFFASALANSFTSKPVPKTWQNRFGPSVWKRYLGAFIGGIILMFGARLAGGCTSGHGISGGLQLALSSWTFLVTLFIIGIPFAFFFYKPKKK